MRTWLRFRTRILAAALFLATLLLYWPATHHSFLDYDDDRYVTANVFVQHGLTRQDIEWAFSNPVCANWHPVTVLSHMLDCELYGLNPWGHHLTNLLFHGLNSVLLFLLLRRLTGAFWRPATVAAFFACHPLHVESVAWLAERKDVLSACFGFLALLFYVRYAQRRTAGKAPAGDPPAYYASPFYWLAWFCFAFGLLSKPMLVTWPFVLLLLDYWPLGRFQSDRWRPVIIEKIPFLVTAAAASVVTFIVQKGTGAMSEFEHLPLAWRCENALVSYCRYLFKLFWPVHLAVFYPHPKAWPAGWVLLAGLLVCGASVLFWLKAKRFPFLLTGWFWFLGTLVPVIGLVQVGIQSMADRYTYLPSVGLLVAIIWGIFELARPGRHGITALSAGIAVALALCCVLTRQQLIYWQNSESLFRHSLEVTGDNYTALNNLGVALLDENQTGAAIPEFQAALRLKPDCVEACNNLGNALLKTGDAKTATEQFRKAIQIQPAFALAHYNLGGVLANQGQTNSAIGEFITAIQLQPDYFNARNNLAILLAAQGQTNEAIQQFREALWLKPDDVNAHFNFGTLLAKSGNPREAIRQFLDVVRVNTNDAETYYKLGNLLAKEGNIGEAIEQFSRAIQAKADFPEAHNNLGSQFSGQGRIDDAIGQFQEAVRVRPDYGDAHYNLANALIKNGRVDEAITHYQIVVKLSANFGPGHYYLGVALAKKGQLEDAIAQFREAIRLRPNDAMAHNKLGICLGETGRMEEAISEFEEAVRLKPDYVEATNNLSRAKAAKNGPAKP